MGATWTELAVGLIMISSPWVLGFSDISLAKWCNVLIGLFLVLVSAWTIFGEASSGEPAGTAEAGSETKHPRHPAAGRNK